MRRLTPVGRVAVAVLLAGLLLAAAAQTGAGYDLTWSTVDGGGAMVSAGGGFTLGGAIGQPDATVGQVGNLPYTLTGEFWAAQAGYTVYAPLLMK